MKFLLVAVNAKYIHSNPALYSLRAYSGELAQYVEIQEYTINHLKDQVLSGIYEAKPDVVGFSCYIWNIEFIKSIVKDLRKIRPELPIWLGGPEVSYDAEKMLADLPEATGVMCGEGEAIFRNLLRQYVEFHNMSNFVDSHNMTNAEALHNMSNTKPLLNLWNIPGLVWRNGSEILRNVDQEPISLDEVPFLYDNMEPFANRIVYYESSRGCPFSCSYCLSSIDKRVRFRNLDIVKKELQYFLDLKIPQVKFVDRTFNCRKSHSMGIWQFLMDHDNGVTNFHFEISADLISPEELDILSKMRPGLVQFEIGVQSTNPETLTAIHRGASFARISEVTETIRGFRNIHQHLDLIAGLPFENAEQFAKSFDDVYALKPDQLQLGFLKVLKGSEMAERAKEYGILYRSEAPYEVLSTRWISYGELLELKTIEEMVEIYYNSGMFPHTLGYVVGVEISPYGFYKKLAHYYKKKQLLEVKHTRCKRYEIFHDFAAEQWPKQIKEIDGLLLWDYYLRENARVRPYFAASQDLIRKEINDFYRKEAEQRKYLPGYEKFNGKQMMNMTHLEFFDFDVEYFAKTGERVDKMCAILYDYQVHDGFTKDGETCFIREVLEDAE